MNQNKFFYCNQIKGVFLCPRIILLPIIFPLAPRTSCDIQHCNEALSHLHSHDTLSSSTPHNEETHDSHVYNSSLTPRVKLKIAKLQIN